MTRRIFLATIGGAAAAVAQQLPAQKPSTDTDPPEDWVCPMDADVHLPKPGVCPRCGMKLTLHVPDRIEFPLVVSQSPEMLRPGEQVVLTLQALDPSTGKPVQHFETVHEKLMHLFLVSENLEFFAHDHPTPRSDGSFTLAARLPYGGMYRLLADFYPSGSVPQLAVNTLYVSGTAEQQHINPALAPCKSANLTASLRLEPEQPLAGLQSRLFYHLEPGDGLEPYLGAWGHMLAASSDLIDLLHLHPFLANGSSSVQFNVIFPRPGLYRVWTQFQRQGVVNTVVHTIPIKAI